MSLQTLPVLMQGWSLHSLQVLRGASSLGVKKGIAISFRFSYASASAF